mmetsp:Transcript_27444/g.69458  ORF Transcript_27444/g.69458 Transcript_27444/m.69458 type:complete len:376 (+) Transcript_27444:118-1245(+)
MQVRSEGASCKAAAAQELACTTDAGAHLQQREVRAAEHSLGFLQAVNLVGTRRLASVVVLQQPVALGMQRHDVRLCGLQLLACGLLLGDARLHRGLHTSHRRLLVRQPLGVHGPLLSGVRHHLLVLLLGVLLLGLRNGHLPVQVTDQEVHHLQDSATLRCFRGVGCCGLRRRWRCAPLGSQLHEGCRRGALPQRRCVELRQAVLGENNDFLRRTIVGHQLLVRRVLGLAQLRGLNHGLVQRDDARLQGLDLLDQSLDALLGLGDRNTDVLQGALQPLFLVVGGVHFCRAVLLLVVVVFLLDLQAHDQLVDQRQDLVEAGLAAMQRERDEVQTLALLRQLARASLGQERPGLRTQRGRGPLHLKEAHGSARQGFFE